MRLRDRAAGEDDQHVEPDAGTDEQPDTGSDTQPDAGAGNSDGAISSSGSGGCACSAADEPVGGGNLAWLLLLAGFAGGLRLKTRAAS